MGVGTMVDGREAGMRHHVTVEPIEPSSLGVLAVTVGGGG